jgi:signal transduction histidine kinase
MAEAEPAVDTAPAAWRPTRVDLTVVAVLLAVAVPTYLAAPAQPEFGITHGPDPLGFVLVLGMTVPLVARRAAPVTVAVGTIAALCGTFFYGSYAGVSQLGAFAAVGSAAYFKGPRTSALLAVVLTLTVNVSFAVTTDPAPPAADLVSNAAIVLVLVGIGVVLRRERLAVERMREAELRERATALREAVAQDRVRIAREMHDIVGHALAGITLQARMGKRQAQRDAAAAAATFATIDSLASNALVETREAVGLMRADAPAGEPPHRLTDLPALVAGVRGEELRVELRQVGAGAELPAAVQSSAYRIVQESLSNVVKHAGPARAVVRVEHQPDALVLDIRDDGRGAPAGAGAGGGHGLRGMRERVAQLGGVITAGPAADGGWHVHARIPRQGVAPTPVDHSAR